VLDAAATPRVDVDQERYRMRRHIKIQMAALAAALTLTTLASTADALRSLSIENAAGGNTLALNGVVTFEGLERGSFRISCPTTIVKTISRSFPKTSLVLIGRVTDFRTAEPDEERCKSTVGTLVRIRTLNIAEPGQWRMFYDSFEGTLPVIRSLLIRLDSIQIRFDIRIPILGTIDCLYEDVENTIGMVARVEGSGAVERLLTQSNTLFGRGNAGGCPERLEFQAALNPLQVTRLVLL
jgi:hypothetical protein